MKTKLLNIAVLCVLLCGCAHHYEPETFKEPYGFWSGIWHGAICLLTITINLISFVLQVFGIDFLKDIQIIGRPNTGFFYYFGFLIGLFVVIPKSNQE